MSRRVDRLNEQLKREIAQIVHREVKDPRVGAPAITGVETTPDLAYAKVYVTATTVGDADRDEVLEGLEAAAPFVRSTLAQRLHTRRVPELEFLWDESLERARRIEALLAQVRPDADDEPDGAPVGE